MARAEKKTRKRINPFDVVIVLLVLCLLATLAYRIYRGVEKKDESNVSEYVLTFNCEGKTESLSEYLDKGTPIYLSATGDLLGYVYDGKNAVTVSEVTESVTLPETSDTEDVTDGAEAEIETETAERSPYKDAYIQGKIHLSEEVSVYNNGVYYSLGDVNFTVGSKLSLYTEDAVFTVTVESVSRIDQ